MAEHPNVTLIRKGFAAFNTGDMATLREIIATDACHHVPGTHRFSGDHKGRDEILAFYTAIGEMTQGQYAAELQEVYANDHRAVAIYRATGRRAAMTLDQRYAMCFEIIDGKAIDLDEIPLDGEVTDAFWN